MTTAKAPDALVSLRTAWEAAWPQALLAWSKFTRLRPPHFCLTTTEAKQEGLDGSFAMIRLVDQAVIVSLPEVLASNVQALAVEVLAHEIGHHVLAPATLTDHGRCIARMRWALPTLEKQAPMIANLYTDLLINDRLQRSAGLRMAEVYRALAKGSTGSALWTVYLRIDEVLWSLERGVLQGGPTDDRQEGDAWLGARLVRSYAHDWLDGAGRFATLMLPYLLQDKAMAGPCGKLFDTREAAQGGDLPGLSEEELGERAGAVHPAADPDLAGDEGRVEVAPREPIEPAQDRSGQTRQPFQYGEILRAAGIALSDHDVAVRYYRERARPHLVRYPSRLVPESTEPLPEGLEPWDIGQSLDDVDWLQSVLVSPHVIPGVTTVQRLWGTAAGQLPEREPLDLDLYVDSSGSMVNPQQQLSFPALAGTIICLSALRAGARVQATLWSGAEQFKSTDGFVRDEEALLRILTGHFGGATAFPIHTLRETFRRRPPTARPAHILVVSDDGVSTMFDTDEQGNSGWKIAAESLARARGGGTLVLQLMEGWETQRAEPYASIQRASTEGWDVHRVASWNDLVEFARRFSRQRYGEVT
jgi:hypothetical protein